MKDIEIHQAIGIPLQTLQNWKSSNNYRKLLYELVKGMPKEYIKEVKNKMESDERIGESFSNIVK
jgi:hypothetical protein